jgi:hypothetical protein
MSMPDLLRVVPRVRVDLEAIEPDGTPDFQE